MSDRVTYAKNSGRMRVTYNGESKDAESTKGSAIKLENGKEYRCMEKEYHSGVFVRIQLDSGDKVKVKRSDLAKIM